MKQFFFYVFLFTGLVSCKKNTVFTEVKIKDKFSIQLPDYLSPAKEIHQEASLQYQNQEKEVYMVVMDESIESLKNNDPDNNLEGYYKNIVSQPFLESVKNAKISIPGRQQIHGANALITQITGEISGVPVLYKLAVIETKSNYCQVLIWTKAANREEYEQDMDTIIESLKQL